MIFNNAELYNISEMLPADDGRGYELYRYPKAVAAKCEKAWQANTHSCGVEIRFNFADDSKETDVAEITVSAALEGAQSFCMLYYGNVASGWQNAFKYIREDKTVITVPKPSDADLERMRIISELSGYPFDPSLVRLLFPVTKMRLYDINGNITPPRKEQTPGKKYLAYGSSITHGSLGILPVNTYAYRTAETLGVDLINLGVAGSACLDKAAADYIAGRNDWDFATLEMGINILGIDPEDFRNRVMYMIKTVGLAHPDKKVFCIDVFYCNDDIGGGGKAERFRQIVRECVEHCKGQGMDNLVYINGIEMLTGPHGLSGDFVHPNVRGCEEIARNLSAAMKPHLS